MHGTDAPRRWRSRDLVLVLGGQTERRAEGVECGGSLRPRSSMAQGFPGGRGDTTAKRIGATASAQLCAHLQFPSPDSPSPLLSVPAIGIGP